MEAGVSSVVSVQDEFLCVGLVMPHCMFGMHLFLSGILSFVLTESKASYTNLSSRVETGVTDML